MQMSAAQWIQKTCAVAKQKLEDFDDRCIILIQLFRGYSVSEVLHAKVACARNTRVVLHARVTWHMHGVACHMHGHSFLVEREC